MELKSKFTQHFAAKSNGDREITFLANSGKPMASGETVDLQTLSVRDPDTGELVFVRDLKQTDVKNWLPLLKDHIPSIDAKIGQVRALWLDDSGLMMTAKLASTPDADKIYQLAKDDMLDTFSITVAYNDQPENGLIKNSQLLETSAVWLGNDETTKLKSVNEMEDKMAETTVKQNELTADEAQQLKDVVAQLSDKIDSLVASDQKPADDTKPADDGGSSDTPQEPSQNSMRSVTKNTREVVKNAPVHQVTVSTNNDYLKSKQAVKDFTRAIVENRGQRAQLEAWNRTLKKNGFEGDILPTDIEQVFFKTWFDEDSILSTFRFTTARLLDLNAFTGDGENIRAKGHKPGETKAEQVFSNITRQVQVKGIYKMLGFDLQQLVDDASGELTSFRTAELAKRVAHEIARGAILGDGRAAPADNAPDYRVFDGTRGLYSIKADIDGSTAANSYAKAVATQVTAPADSSLWEEAVRVLSEVRTTGPKVLVLPRNGKRDILLSKDANSRLQFAAGTNAESLFESGTKIFELDGLETSGYDAIAYANNGYVLTGDRNGRVFTDYDIYHNRDVMEVVRYVGGSLDGGSSEGGQIAAGVKKAQA